MRTNKWNTALALGLLLAVALACSFSASTANIGSLGVSKDKAGSQTASAFEPGDTVYARAEIANSISTVKVKAHIAVEDVAGQPSGPIAASETSMDMPSSGTATFTFTPPAAGWPKGKYKVEVVMLNENGEQKDQKSASFTVE
jgi:hypothetical protein